MMSVLNPCDKDVFYRGTVLCIFEGTSEEAEEFCKERTKHTGHKHDWHTFAGRKVVKYLAPDPDTIQLPRAEYEMSDTIQVSGAEYEVLKKKAARYDYLLNNMGTVEEYARSWNPAKHKPLLAYLQDFIDAAIVRCVLDEKEE
jgi:hypothetical protein